jgi:N-methylhydantoinase A
MDGGRPRVFFDAALRQSVTAREVERADMAPGVIVEGPAVVVENETSTIVTSAFSVIGQGDGSLLLLRKGAEQ